MSAQIAQPCDIIAETLFDWIGERYSETRNAAKKLAALASFEGHSVSHRTTGRWLKRKAVPCPTSTEILAARCEELAARLQMQRELLRAKLK